MAHIATLESGELVGFAISGAEGRGKVFLYELHVAAAHRRRGFATALIELAERSSTSRSASAKTIELNDNVHSANASSIAFYERIGFAESSRTSGGTVLVMRRRR